MDDLFIFLCLFFRFFKTYFFSFFFFKYPFGLFKYTNNLFFYTFIWFKLIKMNFCVFSRVLFSFICVQFVLFLLCVIHSCCLFFFQCFCADRFSFFLFAHSSGRHPLIVYILRWATKTETYSFNWCLPCRKGYLRYRNTKQNLQYEFSVRRLCCRNGWWNMEWTTKSLYELHISQCSSYQHRYITLIVFINLIHLMCYF